MGKHAGRYELSHEQWVVIEKLLPEVLDFRGLRCDNRRFINGVLWILRSGARWCDLPLRYGKYKSVHKRFADWAKRGVWERIFALLTKDRDNEYRP